MRLLLPRRGDAGICGGFEGSAFDSRRVRNPAPIDNEDVFSVVMTQRVCIIPASAVDALLCKSSCRVEGNEAV